MKNGGFSVKVIYRFLRPTRFNTTEYSLWLLMNRYSKGNPCHLKLRLQSFWIPINPFKSLLIRLHYFISLSSLLLGKCQLINIFHYSSTGLRYHATLWFRLNNHIIQAKINVYITLLLFNFDNKCHCFEVFFWFYWCFKRIYYIQLVAKFDFL